MKIFISQKMPKYTKEALNHALQSSISSTRYEICKAGNHITEHISTDFGHLAMLGKRSETHIWNLVAVWKAPRRLFAWRINEDARLTKIANSLVCKFSNVISEFKAAEAFCRTSDLVEMECEIWQGCGACQWAFKKHSSSCEVSNDEKRIFSKLMGKNET